MVILALDTTTPRGSVALARNGRLVAVASGNRDQTHGQRLPGEVQSLLQRHELTIRQVDRYVVAVGPGSFTGLRVGIATVQALALVHGRQVIGLSVLDTLTEIAARRPTGNNSPPELIVPWMDAKRGEVFSALYAPAPEAIRAQPRMAAGARWRVIEGPVAAMPEVLVDTWRKRLVARRVLVIGDGVARDQALLASTLGSVAGTVVDLPPLAGIMAEMASSLPWSGQAVAPHALHPVYVRRPDAELARARRTAGTGTG